MLLDFGDSPVVGRLSALLRMDDLVEIGCQPIFVMCQLAKALLRSLKLFYFAWIVGFLSNSAYSAAFARN